MVHEKRRYSNNFDNIIYDEDASVSSNGLVEVIKWFMSVVVSSILGYLLIAERS